jgi:hypothetical protein
MRHARCTDTAGRAVEGRVKVPAVRPLVKATATEDRRPPEQKGQAAAAGGQRH